MSITKEHYMKFRLYDFKDHPKGFTRINAKNEEEAFKIARNFYLHPQGYEIHEEGTCTHEGLPDFMLGKIEWDEGMRAYLFK